MTDLPKNFANHPKSITEIKSDRSNLAEDATPRDALIEMLREIDSGSISPDHLIISYLYRDANGVQRTGYHCAGKNGFEGIGLLTANQISMAGGR
jgi:hypothetical protein